MFDKATEPYARKLRKRSVYVGQYLEALLTRHACFTGNTPYSVSGYIESLAERYTAVIRQSTPALSYAEWCLILDAMSSPFIPVGGLETIVSRIATDVANHVEHNGSGDKWKVDASGLVSKLAAMRFAERLAIVDICERFWNNHQDPRPYIDIICELAGEHSVTDAELVRAREAHK